jgi:hypothetical protein
MTVVFVGRSLSRSMKDDNVIAEGHWRAIALANLHAP